MAPPAQAKTMSSRLLTMKFMQRAAASPSSTPSTPDGPPSKRQRLSTGSHNSLRTPDYGEAVQAAIAAEELKREQALEKAAADAGETRWVLSFRDEDNSGKGMLRVVSKGFAEIDRDEGWEASEEEEKPMVGGRMSFGKIEKPKESGDSSSESSSSDEDSDDPTGAGALIRESRKEAARQKREAKKKVANAKAAEMAEARRKKEVKLNRLSSISGGGGLSGRGGGSPNAANVECHQCGKKGHFARDCPQKRKRKSSEF